jgi:hypothetical protein
MEDLRHRVACHRNTIHSADQRLQPEHAGQNSDRSFGTAGIQKGVKLNAPIGVGNVAVTMLQLSNVALGGQPRAAS